jgi:zinc transport system substrate-binding protein
VLAAGLFAACSSGHARRAETGGRLPVVASFYPIYEAAWRVGGEDASVTNLTPAGAEPHDLELTSRQVDRIEDAALVFYLGDGFQPALDKVVRRAGANRPGTAGGAVDLLTPDIGLVRGDPHIWLDPALYLRVVERIRAAYQEADPAHASVYAERANGYIRELAELDQTYRSGLQSCDRRVIVTSHAAFGYLAREYGLKQEAVSGLSPESEPEPKQLSALAREVKAQGVTTIFSETLLSPRVAQALAREAGVSTAVLNPLEGLTADEAKAGKTYTSVMGDNLNTLRAALGCR